MFNYVMLANGVVVGVQQSPRAIDAPDLVPVDAYDPDLLGRAWVDGKPGERAAVVAVQPVADWLESLTPAEFAAVEARAVNDPEVLQFLRVAELRGYIDPAAPATVAVAAKLAPDIGAGKAPDKGWP